jgi:predicted DNA binding protein
MMWIFQWFFIFEAKFERALSNYAEISVAVGLLLFELKRTGVWRYTDSRSLSEYVLKRFGMRKTKMYSLMRIAKTYDSLTIEPRKISNNEEFRKIRNDFWERDAKVARMEVVGSWIDRGDYLS